jgi:hypothetical protein
MYRAQRDAFHLIAAAEVSRRAVRRSALQRPFLGRAINESEHPLNGEYLVFYLSRSLIRAMFYRLNFYVLRRISRASM